MTDFEHLCKILNGEVMRDGRNTSCLPGELLPFETRGLFFQ